MPSKSGPQVPPPDPDILDKLRRSRSLTIQELAEKAGVSTRTIDKLLAGQSKSVARETMQGIRNVFGVSDDALYGLDLMRGTTPAGIDAYRLPTDGMLKQEWKHIIVDTSISNSILCGKAPPLADCIRATRAFAPFDDTHKDYPASPQMRYNHFFQITAIITLVDKKQDTKEILAYRREPRLELPQHVHTQGQSILWSAWFSYHLQQIPWGPMDKWMDMVRLSADESRRQFTAERDSVLAQILSSTIDLRDVPIEASPHVVITKDDRIGLNSETRTRRVYTHFVFRLSCSQQSLKASERPEVAQRTYGVAWSCLPYKPLGEHTLNSIFSNRHTGTLNAIDVLAWKSMFGAKCRLDLQTATLTSGFALT